MHGIAFIFLSVYVYFLVSILKIQNLEVFITILPIYVISYGSSWYVSKVLLKFFGEYDSLEFRKIMKDQYIRWVIYIVCWIIIGVYFWSVAFVKGLITEQIVNKKILEQIWIFDIIHFTFGIFLCCSTIIHISSIEKIMTRTRLIE